MSENSDRIARNIQKMLQGGASEEEVQAYVASEKSEFQNAPEQPGEELRGSWIDPLAQGVTMDLGDEIQGIGGIFAKFYNDLTGQSMGASGITGEAAPTYRDMYEGVRDEARADEAAFAERNPNTAMALKTAGAITTGGAGGARLLAKEAPAVVKAAGVPFVGGVEGAIQGFGAGEGLEESLTGMGEEGVKGLVLGKVMDKVLTPVSRRLLKGRAKRQQQFESPTQTLESTRARSKAFYKDLDSRGVKIKAESYIPFKRKFNNYAREESLDAGTYPGIGRALTKIRELRNPNWKQLEAVKKRLARAKMSQNADTARAANDIDAMVDDYIAQLSPDQISAGNVDNIGETLEAAKDLWGKHMQASTLEDIKFKASLSSSDYDTAVTQGVRSLITNPRRRAGMDKEALSSLEDIVTGGGTKGAQRIIAGMTPGTHTRRGLLPTAGAAGAGYLIGGPKGALLTGLIPPVAGGLSSRLAGQATRKEFDNVMEAILNKNQKPLAKITEELATKYGPEIKGIIGSLANAMRDPATAGATQLTDMLTDE